MICRLIGNTIRTADWVFAHVLVKVGELIDNAVPSDAVIRANVLAKYEEDNETWEPGELKECQRTNCPLCADDEYDPDDWQNIYNHRKQARWPRSK